MWRPQNLAKWRALSSPARLMALEMVLLLASIRVALRLFPLPSVQKGLDWIADTFPAAQGADAAYRQRVAWAASAVSSRLLVDRPCLTQALAVQWLFRRRGYPADLCIGVVKDAGKGLLAHAWVESNGVVVIGGAEEDLKQYARLRS